MNSHHCDHHDIKPAQQKTELSAVKVNDRNDRNGHNHPIALTRSQSLPDEIPMCTKVKSNSSSPQMHVDWSFDVYLTDCMSPSDSWRRPLFS